MIICDHMQRDCGISQICRKQSEEINRERELLIENIVKPTMRRNDVFFDEKTYQNCLIYCEKHYYKLFPYQKFIYAFAFMYKDDIPIFPKFFIMMGRGMEKMDLSYH